MQSMLSPVESRGYVDAPWLLHPDAKEFLVVHIIFRNIDATVFIPFRCCCDTLQHVLGRFKPSEDRALDLHDTDLLILEFLQVSRLVSLADCVPDEFFPLTRMFQIL